VRLALTDHRADAACHDTSVTMTARPVAQHGRGGEARRAGRDPDALATYVEKADALKRKVQSAMVYPAVVLTVAMGATVFMLLFIIPTFARCSPTSAASLPLPTKIVLGCRTCSSTSGGSAAGDGGAAVAFKRYYATEAGIATSTP